MYDIRFLTQKPEFFLIDDRNQTKPQLLKTLN